MRLKYFRFVRVLAILTNQKADYALQLEKEREKIEKTISSDFLKFSLVSRINGTYSFARNLTLATLN